MKALKNQFFFNYIIETAIKIDKIERGSRMIQSFFLLNKGGMCYLSRNYSDLEFDEALIGGFLAAIESLGTQVFKEGTISEIDYGHSKFVYTYEQELIAVAIVDENTDTEPIRSGLSNIIQDFTSTFDVERLKEGDLSGVKEFHPLVDMKLQSLQKKKEDFVSKMDKWVDSF